MARMASYKAFSEEGLDLVQASLENYCINCLDNYNLGCCQGEHQSDDESDRCSAEKL